MGRIAGAMVSAEAERREQSFASAFEKLIEGLPDQIALLDDKWIILAINRSWAMTAASLGYRDLGVGSDYRLLCNQLAAEGHHSASLAAAAIEELERGDRTSFTVEYHGQGELTGRDFKFQINRVDVAGEQFATITRTEVTELMQLRRLQSELGESLSRTQEIERRRVASELHDSTVQYLVSAGLAIGQLKRSAMPVEAGPVVSEIESLLFEAQKEIRSLSYLAYAPQLKGGDLGAALQLLVEGFARRAAMRASMAVPEQLPALDRATELAIYRVVQEALSNVHRHAHAKTLDVRMVTRARAVHLIVADDGVGLPTSWRSGVGLQSMRDRLREIGGRLSARRLEHGTAVIASAPLAIPEFPARVFSTGTKQ